jgi:hypothetical protein
MSKTEIMAELAHLSPQDLAEVRAWLDRQLMSPESIVTFRGVDGECPRIRTPRLADPARAADFIKQVTELAPDASV